MKTMKWGDTHTVQCDDKMEYTISEPKPIPGLKVSHMLPKKELFHAQRDYDGDFIFNQRRSMRARS